MIPTPAPYLYMDMMQLKYTIPQGSQLYTGFGGIATLAIATPYNFTSSPTDPHLLLAGPVNNIGSPTPLGKGKTVLKEWRTEYFMTNVDNSPVEVECICIRAKKDLPVVHDWLEAKNAATGAGALTVPQVKHTFEAWLSNAATAFGFGISNFWINLATLNPNQTSVPDNTCFTNTPGARLTDIPLFNEFFKIVSTKSRVLQPGEAYKWIKFSKRPKQIIESAWIDAFDFSTAGIQFGQMFLAKKGWNYYIWRMQSIPAGSQGGTSANITFGDGHLNIIQTYRYKMAYLSSDQYEYTAPKKLPTNTAEYQLFPGTSQAGPHAPAD